MAIDWKNKSQEWKEKYPRIMKWEDVPEERRVTPEFVLDCRGNSSHAKNEANNLGKRTCEMATDYGSRWGKRFGMYSRCGVPPAPGEKFCVNHGGAKKEKPIQKSRQEKILGKRKECFEEVIASYRQTILEAIKELNYYKGQIEEIINQSSLMINNCGTHQPTLFSEEEIQSCQTQE
jgi:hypothetical protein